MLKIMPTLISKGKKSLLYDINPFHEKFPTFFIVRKNEWLCENVLLIKSVLINSQI